VPRKHLPVLLLLLSIPCIGGLGGTDGKKKVLWVGEVVANNHMFIDMLGTDPRFQLVGTVPCTILVLGYDEAVRFARAYLPRRYSDLVSGTDVMIFHDFSPKVLTDTYLEWFRKGVYEGIGLLLVEFAQRVSMCGMEYWQETTLYDAFPAELYPNCIEAIKGRQRYEIVTHGPLVDFPDMEKIIINWGHHGDLIPKEGTTIWAVWSGRKTPAFVTRAYGNGMVLHYDHGWDTMPDEVKRFWRYLPDYVFNHLCFATGLPFPDDLELVHEARALFAALDEQVRVAISVIEFVDRFGANLRPFEVKLGETRGRRLLAEEAFVDGDMAKATEILADANDDMRQLSNDMMRAKNRALLWVFVIEWLSVTATGMVCGFILWTVMIRRRLYREVAVTRLGER